MRERFRVRKLRTAMVAVTAGCVGMAALAGMHTAQGTVAHWARMGQMDDAVQTQRGLIQTHTQALDGLGVDAGLLLTARRLQEQELRASALAPRALQLLAQTLQAAPGAPLESLAWQRRMLDTACTGQDSAGSEAPAGAALPDPTASATPQPLPGGTEPAAATPRLGLEVRLAFQAPPADSPLAATQWRRRLAEQLAAWPDARLLRGAEAADANQTLSSGPRTSGTSGDTGNGGGGVGGSAGESLSFCLVLAEPVPVAP